MKVLVINWRDIHNPEAGGAEVHIHEILMRKPASWTVDFVAATFPGCEPEQDMGSYAITRIPNNGLFNFTFRRFYKKVLKKRDYDLIIDDVSKIPLATPWYITDRPVLAVHHHVHGRSLFSQLPYPQAWYVYHMERYLLRAYRDTPLISVSESSRDDLLALYPFTRLDVQHNGIDFTRISSAYPGLKPNEQPTILYLGRLKKYKRVDHLLQALLRLREHIPGIQLIIAGKGDDEDRLQELVREWKLQDAVTFLGFISDQEKIKLLHQAWVTAIASEKEGWGISVLEGNAAGLPAVGYDVEGLRDSIRDGETGLLARNGDIDDLAGRLSQILTSPALRSRLSAQARKYAAEFSWDSTAQRFYQSCLSAVNTYKQSQK